MFQGQRDVFECGQRVEESIALKQVAAAAAKPIEQAIFKANFAGIGLQQAGEAFQKDRLSGAASSEHGDDAASRHRQVDRGQDNMVAEMFAQADDLQNGWKGRADHTRKEVIK